MRSDDMNESIKLICPVCQTESNQGFQLGMNTQTHAHLKKELLNGTLLTFECQYCGAKRRMNVPFLYHDPDKELLFYLSPHYFEKRDQVDAKLQQILQSFPISLEHYEMRIVTDPSQLIEKIQLFDLGYHDTEIELLKMLTDGLFIQEHPDMTIQDRYLYLNNTNEAKFIYFADDNQYLVEFNKQLVPFIRSKFKKILAQSYQGNFTIINQHWADACLQKKYPDTTPDATEGK